MDRKIHFCLTGPEVKTLPFQGKEAGAVPAWGSMTRCNNCGEVFERKSPKQKFCSRTCSATFNNKGRRRNGNTPTLCKGCGISTGRSDGVYCSNECRYQSNVRLWLAGEIDGSWKYTHAAFVRRYLSEKSGEKCERCGYDIKRQDGSSILQVDHIDGDWRNNRPDNLRLLCPNCHALTDTWGAANMGNGRKWKKKYKQFGDNG